ncbi:MAG: SxtJ family membrane protein [Acidobacteriota bacterium]
MALIEINWHPDGKQLRSFAWLWLVFFALAGAVVAWRAGLIGGVAPPGASWTTPVILWTLAVVVSAVGLAFPAAIRPVYLVWMGASFPIGWTVSHILLGATYFGLFTLVAVIFRLMGRDALARRLDRGAATYWVKRSPPADVARYFKQF